MADLKDIEEKLDLIIKNQKEIDNRMSRLENSIKRIESDIYLDEENDFEIVCPYCNYEFTIDIDEEDNEVTCPECNNVIELDWTGDLDNNSFDCGPEGCSGCHGCDSFEDEEDDM